jgi:hypothetical protein
MLLMLLLVVQLLVLRLWTRTFQSISQSTHNGRRFERLLCRVVSTLHGGFSLRPNLHRRFQFFDCSIARENSVTNLLLSTKHSGQKRGVDNALCYERAAKRKPSFNTCLQSGIELIGTDDICIYQQFSEPVGRTLGLGMAVHALERFMNRLAVACCNCQSLNAYIRRNQPVTNN